jgi:Holliday junction resolvase RusA-like endonuclease
MTSRKYSFKVESIVPPRNVRTNNSMWNNKTEVPRLIELRKKALDAFNGDPSLFKNITLSVSIYLPRTYNKPGDLDNFIKGICDGLMRCPNHPQLKLHETFEKKEYAKIHPKSFAVIDDDEQILKITAEKYFEDIRVPFYEITLEGSDL